MNSYHLPKSIKIKDKDIEIFSDYRDILELFKPLNDPDLLEFEKITVALGMFYKTDDYLVDIDAATKEMFSFITMNNDFADDDKSTKQEKPLYDWDKDFNIIVAPINKILGYDVRGVEYLHWWTFLSAFMEIGECTFSTYVGIRNKLNKGKKLEKWEEQILKENRDKIIIKTKVDSTTQALMDEIMGI